MPECRLTIELAARRFFEKVATPQERRRIEDILNSLVTDPYVDDETRFPFSYPPANSVLYADGEFWVLYEIEAPGAILVLNIGFEEEIPSAERDEPLL